MSNTNRRLTLSQALRRVSALKGLVATLTERASANVLWEGDSQPVFDFVEVLALREAAVLELIELKAAIARVNAVTTAEFEGHSWTLQQLVFYQAELKGLLAFYSGLRVCKHQGEVVVRRGGYAYDEDGERRVVRDEIAQHSAITERSRVEKTDELRRQIGELNGLLEARNHTTEVEVRRA